MENFHKELDLVIRARYPAIQIVTWEEARALEALQTLATRSKKSMEVWSPTESFDQGSKKSEPANPLEALDRVIHGPDRCFYVLLDFHKALEDPSVVRRVREAVRALRRSYKTLLLVGPVPSVPVELEKDITLLDLPLPKLDEIGRALDKLIQDVSGKLKIDLSDDLKEKLTRAAHGLTLEEAQTVFSKALLHDRQFSEKDVQLILFEKEQIIRKSGLLEYIRVSDSLNSVGGLDKLKHWLSRRGDAFDEKAREFGLPNPKGLLLLGVQGCGKSLLAKVVAAQWRFPLVRLDMGSLFSSYVGSSEANMRKAITIAEGLAPVVLWMDEIEKGLAGSSDGSGDGGVGRRMIGSFLTWMQEKTAPVFVIATANAIDKLPPELLRKGRFDEIFFVDLPGRDSRKEIFKIHLEKRNRSADRFDLDALADVCDGFSGAEIEQAIIDGMFEAYHQNRDLRQEDVIESIVSTVPLSKTSAEAIASLRAWAADRATPAQ